ncbi:helix-turn-helix domain-containing protein [Stackebrandtia nassauensis]|uniref:Transcriptional regulator, XRE family n=1 Tax=Stackebrandtia nassauensis (strain DSM 44728 / CIP 108903 / NRRL B-16338 / NBRC 102104 / LLR-40K-21) TaxID=446470 RepID=D3Q6H9_STANL|nr:helix-turn-helix transcriptional regulator [Stackebrandtia nassauensis]ADD44222.1 transcriptional regulator, XRE family [Stackebrandtia nassauensis DSM 44728]
MPQAKDDAATLAAFLRARRARVTPADVGLPPGGARRVPGLRREELALLAGVSVDYYTRLEQGRDTHPSAEVLDALARVLRLNEDSRAHLHSLATAPRRRSQRRAAPSVRPSVQRMLDSMRHVPALIVTPYMDVLAFNRLGSALYPGLAELSGRERNVIRMVFLSEAGQDLFPEWQKVTAEAVAFLRAALAPDPHHPRVTELVGELSIHSDEFRRLWARHEVAQKRGGTKTFRHPQVGELTLEWDVFAHLDDGAMLVTYTAVPNSPDEERLMLLSSLAEPEPARAEPVAAPHET